MEKTKRERLNWRYFNENARKEKTIKRIQESENGVIRYVFPDKDILEKEKCDEEDNPILGYIYKNEGEIFCLCKNCFLKKIQGMPSPKTKIIRKEEALIEKNLQGKLYYGQIYVCQECKKEFLQ